MPEAVEELNAALLNATPVKPYRCLDVEAELPMLLGSRHAGRSLARESGELAPESWRYCGDAQKHTGVSCWRWGAPGSEFAGYLA